MTTPGYLAKSFSLLVTSVTSSEYRLRGNQLVKSIFLAAVTGCHANWAVGDSGNSVKRRHLDIFTKLASLMRSRSGFCARQHRTAALHR